MRIPGVLVMVCLLLLATFGCATTEPAYIPLAKEMSQRINSSNAVIVSAQHEIKADVEKSMVATVTGGGLIPALIDVAVEHSRSKSAEEAIKPIRDALADFDIGEALQAALGTRLETIGWLNVKKSEILYDQKADLVPTLMAASPEDVLVLITPSYSLSTDFVTLTVESEVKVLPRAAHLRASSDTKDSANGRVTPLYKNVVKHVVPLPDTTAPVAQWTKDGGTAIKEAIRQSIDSIASQIISSLTNPATPSNGELTASK
jgi:hypothetical protein